MGPLFGSFAVVALAEMGDKTQLLALVLGLRYRRPWTVMPLKLSIQNEQT